MKDALIDGIWRSITRGEVYQGAWKAVTRGEAYIGGDWEVGPTAYTPTFSLSASPAELSSSESGSSITSEETTATPNGGLPPYTYAWVKLFGAGESLSPTSAITAFRMDGISDFNTGVGIFRVTATDNLGSTATADVTVELTNTGG